MTNSWQPKASIANLRLLAQLLAKIRHFFAERNVMEVETPLLCHAGVPDPHIHSFTSKYYAVANGQPQVFYLQTSPEFAMKRLLAAGSGAIYQINKAFRNQGETGRWHNPEFTLLEWYRPDFTHIELMDETDLLLQVTLETQPAERISYQALFEQYVQINPITADINELKHKAHAFGLKLSASFDENIDRDDWLNLLMTHVIEPHIGFDRPLFVYNFPASQAALARLNPTNPKLAERFEVYVNGMELANGFHELCDSAEQRKRFLQDLAWRQERALDPVPLDEHLLSALEAGLPYCAGIALGVDRLLMIAAKAQQLADVISFTIDNA